LSKKKERSPGLFGSGGATWWIQDGICFITDIRDRTNNPGEGWFEYLKVILVLTGSTRCRKSMETIARKRGWKLEAGVPTISNFRLWILKWI